MPSTFLFVPRCGISPEVAGIAVIVVVVVGVS